MQLGQNGFEPLPTEPQSVMLPLHHCPHKCHRQSSTMALNNDILQNTFFIFTQSTRCRESRRRNRIYKRTFCTPNCTYEKSNLKATLLFSSRCYHLPSLTTLTSRVVQATGFEPATHSILFSDLYHAPFSATHYLYGTLAYLFVFQNRQYDVLASVPSRNAHIFCRAP